MKGRFIAGSIRGVKEIDEFGYQCIVIKTTALESDLELFEDQVLKLKDKYFAKGGMTKSQKKIGKVMREFKKGELHSGKKGPVVKNPKQAIAIALSEAGQSKMKKAAEGDMMGGLSGKQSKLDANKDGQISGEDFKILRTKNKRGGGMAERGMGQAFSKGGAVRGTGAAIRGTRPAKLY
jgi:hypothetical protein